MTTDPLPAGDRLRVVRLLLLLEALVAAVSTVESAVVAGVGLGSPATVLLTGALVVVLALGARTAGRGRATRTAMIVQAVLLASAGIDVVIALVVQVAPLLLPTLVRIALPATVLVLLRRERRAVRAAHAAAQVPPAATAPRSGAPVTVPLPVQP
jgi:hypothetical protein